MLDRDDPEYVAMEAAETDWRKRREELMMESLVPIRLQAGEEVKERVFASNITEEMSSIFRTPEFLSERGLFRSGQQHGEITITREEDIKETGAADKRQ